VQSRKESPPYTEPAESGDPGRGTLFVSLYRAHAGRIYAICLRMLGDADRAKDASQTACMKAWQHFHTLADREQFSSWIRRITFNVVVDQLRTKRGDASRLGFTGEMEHFEDGGTIHGPGLSIDLEDAIRSLPAGARAVIVMHDIEGFRHEEIARILGITEGTSKAQLHRARRLLRERLES